MGWGRAGASGVTPTLRPLCAHTFRGLSPSPPPDSTAPKPYFGVSQRAVTAPAAGTVPKQSSRGGEKIHPNSCRVQSSPMRMGRSSAALHCAGGALPSSPRICSSAGPRCVPGKGLSAVPHCQPCRTCVQGALCQEGLRSARVTVGHWQVDVDIPQPRAWRAATPLVMGYAWWSLPAFLASTITSK